MRYDGEQANVYDGQGNREFVSTYALECRKIGAKYLAALAKRRANQGLNKKGEFVNE